ncbi:MAG TPA: AMP-binding protein [Candidatus Polarisedimenticolia bacterium]|nr:AMP-binding protein [Candidatus Polarisedimenticolia bacterium]
MHGSSAVEASLIGDVPALAAHIWSKRTALFFGKQRVSYRDLSDRVGELALKLAASGLERGDRVAIWLENRPEYVHLYYGLPAAGLVTVPLNTFLSPRELANILADCKAAGLVTTADAIDKIAPELSSLSELKRLFLLGDDGADGAAVTRAVPQAETIWLGAGGEEPPRGGVLPPAIDPDDTAVIIYTSGTTGRPKGVMLSHLNLLSNARACIEAVGIGPRDKILLFLPMFHSFTQTVCMLAPLMGGMGIVLCAKVDRAQIKAAITRWRPTIFAAVPSVYAAMARARLGRVARSFNPIRIYISGGAPLGLETLKEFETKYRRPLCEGYGLSEAAPVVCLNPPGGPRKPGSIGVPLPGIETRIICEDGRVAGPEEIGELQVRGPNVMAGYFGLTMETEHAIQGGWLRTGDMARRDREGYLYLVGRSKDLILFRGMNVYPREIEVTIEEIAGVKEAVVVGVPDDRRGEVPHAFVVPHPGEEVDGGRLRRACSERLARYKVPRAFWVVEELPRNPAGKVLKEALRDRAVSLQAGRSVGGRSSRVLRPGM